MVEAHSRNLKTVGQRLPQAGAVDKVTGRAEFTGDVQLPGMLHAALVKSPVAKGRIRSIGTEPALEIPGVRAVITGDDLKRPPIDARDVRYGVVVRDKPILAQGRVSYVGEPVAAVVAEDPRTARAAADLVQVDVEAEEAVVGLEEALAEGAPLVHTEAFEKEDAVYSSPVPLSYGKSNVAMVYETADGDVESALARASKVVEAEYSFPAVYHYAMEPYCVVAAVNEQQVRVWSSAQHTSQVTKDLARLFGYPLSQVRVNVSYVGGGFGSKSFTHVEPIAVALAKAVGRPVRLELDVSEAMTVSRRHNALARVRMGVDGSGQVVAVDEELYYDTGSVALLGPYVAVKGAFRGLGGYDFPSYRVRSHFVYTNTSPAGSFRAIGGPQAAWALESHLDRLAREYGADPIEYRRRHVAKRDAEFRPGRTAMDADLDEGLAKLAALAEESRRSLPEVGASWRVGHGAAMGVCDPGASPVSSAIARLSADSSLVVTVGSSELGQGVRTVIRQIAAEALDLPYEQVAVAHTDTGGGPYDASTGASRSTVMSGLAAYRAVSEIRARILEMAAEAWKCEAPDIRLVDGEVLGPAGEQSELGGWVRSHFGQNGGSFFGRGEVTKHEFPTTPPFWEVASGAASVAVDEETGQVRMLAYSSVADIGRAVNPMAMEGQEEGAFTQALGHTLFEAISWEDGQIANGSLVEYRVPRFGDAPPAYRSAFVENEDGPGPYGAKGGGEGAIVPVAGAVSSALYDACGVRIADLPMTPERVWRALRDAGAHAAAAADTVPAQPRGKGER